MVIARVVAVRRIRDRKAVFEEQDLRRARGAQSANADVRPQAQAFFIANVDTGYAPERFVDSWRNRQLEIAHVEKTERPGKFRFEREGAADASLHDDGFGNDRGLRLRGRDRKSTRLN